MICCCSLAGTAACRYCQNNPNAESSPYITRNQYHTTPEWHATINLPKDDNWEIPKFMYKKEEEK